MVSARLPHSNYPLARKVVEDSFHNSPHRGSLDTGAPSPLAILIETCLLHAAQLDSMHQCSVRIPMEFRTQHRGCSYQCLNRNTSGIHELSPLRNIGAPTNDSVVYYGATNRRRRLNEEDCSRFRFRFRFRFRIKPTCFTSAEPGTSTLGAGGPQRHDHA